MIITAVTTQSGDCSDLFDKLPASSSYIEAVTSKTNEKSKQQSVAGLRALLFLLDRRGKDMTELVLERAPNGKPFFKSSDMEFGISHSGELAVCALSERPVGIDVEELREIRNVNGLAARFLSKAEQYYVTHSANMSEAFLEVWTKKEAYLKFKGTGISGINLAEIDVNRLSCHTFRYTCNGKQYVISVCGDDEDCDFVSF